MPRNDLYVGRQLSSDCFGGSYHAADASTPLKVYKWKPISNEVIAHVNDVGFCKENDAITIGVPTRKVQGAYIFAVHVNSYIVVKGDDAKRLFRSRFLLRSKASFVTHDAAVFYTCADMLLRDDGPVFLKECISASVIVMVVG